MNIAKGGRIPKLIGRVPRVQNMRQSEYEWERKGRKSFNEIKTCGKPKELQNKMPTL